MNTAVAAELFPNAFVRIFMTPTDNILRIAPDIIRRYGISFVLLPFNVFATYYFQAIMRPTTAFVVSVGRGAVLSGALILLLPAVAGADSLWFAMPPHRAPHDRLHRNPNADAARKGDAAGMICSPAARGALAVFVYHRRTGRELNSVASL